MTVAAVHALVFGLVFYFSNEFVEQLSEGFREGIVIKAPTMTCIDSKCSKKPNHKCVPTGRGRECKKQ